MKQDIFFHEKSIYVTTDFLIERKVPSSTIYNNTSKACPPKRRWHFISHPNDKKAILIAFDSIPSQLVKKYSLPSKDFLFKMYNSYNLINYEKIKDKRYNHIYNSFRWNYELWRDNIENYDINLFEEERIEKLCKTEALFTACLELLKYKKYKIKDLYDVYSQFDDVVFKTESHKSFCNKLRKIRNGVSVQEVLIHGLTNMPGNRTKITDDVFNEIMRHYCNPKVLNAFQILTPVNAYLTGLNRKTISISSVYRVIAQPWVKNKCMIARYGIKYAENNLLPYSYFDPPQKVGTLWAMDGSRFQFVYKTEDKKFNFLTFFVIMDCASKMILGYSYDVSENSNMALKAIEQTCKMTNYLPTEIILDNSKALKSNTIIEFIAKIKLMKVYWHLIRPGNSRDNGMVERFFGVFQESYCKAYDGYIGEGITSSRKDGRPSQEELRKQMEGKNLRNKEGLIHLLNELIRTHNTHRTSSKSESPIQKFNKLTIDKKVKKVSTIMYSQLFWPYKEITVNHGVVLFSHNNKEYVFKIEKANILERIGGTKVKVKFTPNDFSKVLVFDFKSDEYITTLSVLPRIPKAMSDRSEEENKLHFENIQKFKALKKEMLLNAESIINQSDRNHENIPPELSEFGIVSKREREDAEAIYLENELQKISKVEETEEIEEADETKLFEKEFQNIFQSKGSLKILNYGKN